MNYLSPVIPSPEKLGHLWGGDVSSVISLERHAVGGQKVEKDGGGGRGRVWDGIWDEGGKRVRGNG